jgi:hypothetical protein
MSADTTERSLRVSAVSNPYGNDPYGQQPPNPSGGAGDGGAYPPPPGGGGFEQPPKTDGVSIASLVLSLLCCAPVGLILGFVGIRRTKGGQRKGRGLAITGVVLGLLGLLVWVGLGIASIAGIGFLSSIVTPDEAKVGQCVNIDSDDDSSVLLREADCDKKHDGEIVAVVKVTDDNLEDVKSQMVGYCIQAISDEDSGKLADYVNDIKAVTENPDDVEVDDHLVCYVEPSDQLDKSIL